MQNESDLKTLQKELEQFRQEKEKIRNIVCQIGGVKATKRDRMINIIFLLSLAALFLLDVLRHFLGIHIALPALFSLELGILLVSIKIIWMIHKQAKVEHFQFWILHSIEFRLNDLSQRFRHIEGRFK